jgi:hypothetical protein
MNKAEALKKYKKIDPEILKQYQDADKYQWYNTNDSDLFPIRAELPEPPDWDKIENFGLPAHKQIFKYEEVPETLKYIIKKIKLDISKDKSLTTEQKKEDAFYDRIWEKIENNNIYKKILHWISDQWYYLLNGKWVFINGKPTYIPKNHWFYLNYWSLEDVDVIEYRDRDRKWFYALEYFKNYTKIPKKDFNGNFFYNDDGSLVEKDVGYRTIEGVIIAKGRRAGDTSKATCDIYCDTILKIDANTGIQGNKEKTGEQVFHNKLMYAYRRLLFIWKPKRNCNVQNALIFDTSDVDNSLNATINYGTASPTEYDGSKLYRYFADEPGKMEKYSIDERHNVVRLCLVDGNRLVGFSIYTTTVNDMSADAGKNFEALCRDSFYEQRTETGSTKSGMVIIHFPADDGYGGFIGKYGESISGKPTQEQLKYLLYKRKNDKGEYIGAREFILMRREAYRQAGQYEKLALSKRLYPLSFAESFAPPINNIYFDMDILSPRISELKRDTTSTIRGNFIGEPEENISFIPDDNGKFVVSKILSKEGACRKMNVAGIWYPQDTSTYVSSSDAYRLEHTNTNHGMSLGAGAVKEKFNTIIDTPDTPPEKYQTGLFVCTYLYRPETLDEYCLDMLRMTVYYNALHFPESNVNHVADYFIKRGFGGYLKYAIDPETGRPKSNAGFYTTLAVKQKIFNKQADHIKLFGRREKHLDYLYQCSEIKDLKDTATKDLFIATGGCLLAEESQYNEYLNEDGVIDIGEW